MPVETLATSSEYAKKHKIYCQADGGYWNVPVKPIGTARIRGKAYVIIVPFDDEIPPMIVLETELHEIPQA